MCPPVVAALIGVAGSAYIAKEQSRKQEQLAERQAEEAARIRKQQEQKFKTDASAAAAIPTLLRNETQKSGAKGLASLNAKKSGDRGSGYNSVGMGGTGSTGLNIPK